MIGLLFFANVLKSDITHLRFQIQKLYENLKANNKLLIYTHGVYHDPNLYLSWPGVRVLKILA